MVYRHDGQQLRRLRQRRLPRLLPGHRRPGPGARWSPTACSRTSAGKRFAEITASSRHRAPAEGARRGLRRLGPQRQRRTSSSRWAGPIHGDRYHNVLFQNPGQGNNWLTVKLVGKKTNRAAIGARIKVVTAGEEPLTVHRHVSSGSSFGANPLEQTHRPGQGRPRGARWRSTGRPAARRRSSATSPSTRRSRSPSSPRTTASSTGSRFRRNEGGSFGVGYLGVGIDFALARQVSTLEPAAGRRAWRIGRQVAEIPGLLATDPFRRGPRRGADSFPRNSAGSVPPGQGRHSFVEAAQAPRAWPRT